MGIRIDIRTVCVLLALAPCAAQEGDPAAEFVSALTSADAAAGIRAEGRLLRLRAAAVPALLRALKTAKQRSPAASRLLELLGRLGRDATAALPTLLAMTRIDANAIEDVFAAVDRIAPWAPDQKDAVIEAMGRSWMKRSAKRKRKLSSATLARIKTRLDFDTSAPASKLIELISGGHTLDREFAAELIANAPGDKAEKLTALLGCIGRGGGRESVNVRFRTGTLSAAIGTSIDNHRPEQLAIARAIVQLSPPKDVPFAAWLALLGDHDPRLVRRAIYGVGASKNPQAVQELIRLTGSRDRMLAWEAITALGMLGAHATTAIHTLETIQENEKDKAAAARAKAALRAIRSAANPRNRKGTDRR